MFEFFRFELKQQVRSPLLWIIAALFGLMAFGAISSDAITIGSAIGNVQRNAPSVIISLFGALTLLGMFVITIFIAGALLRDFEQGTSDLIFACPIRRRDYLLGRFFAGLVACTAIYVLVGVGLLIGQFMPWIDPARLGPFRFDVYLWAFLVIVLPNLLFAGALLALLASITRSMLMVYLGILAFFVLWIVAGNMTRDMENVWVPALADPFGIRAMSREMRYWSAEEQNTLLPALTGMLAVNRVLWFTVAITCLAGMLKFFSGNRAGTGSAKKSAAAAPIERAEAIPNAKPAPRIAGQFDRSASWAMLWRQLRFDLAAVLKSAPFIVMMLFSVINFTGAARFVDSLYGTTVYPVTYLMLDAIAGSSGLFLFLIVLFYAGELIFRERQAKISDVIDAMPTPNWVPLTAKSLTLITVVALFLLVSALAGMGFQLWRGYTNFEIPLYVAGLGIQALPFVLIGLLSIAVMVFTQNKFMGFAVVIVVFVLQTVLALMNYQHNLYNFGGTPNLTYSDMNGYGHYLRGWFWFAGYWLLFVAGLMLLASASWVRGVVGPWRERWKATQSRLKGPLGIALGATTALWLVFLGVIFTNTNVINTYRAADTARDLQARYEKEYAPLKDLPQPRIMGVEAKVDIYPERKAVRVEGEYQLHNPHDVAIDKLYLSLPETITLADFVFTGATLDKTDTELGYRIYTLSPPMAPGSSQRMQFTISSEEKGFGNQRLQTQVVDNGTFFNSRIFPSFGYDPNGALTDRNERRKRGLGEPERMPKLEDDAARANTYLGDDADWIEFATTVCTSKGQVALAPGYLKRQFNEGDRPCFRYEMDQPMLAFFAYLSANWELKSDLWNGLPIEVYYDKAHPYNVDGMIQATKDSLDYFTQAFSPYQHKQVRIIEFPRYAQFAQSFANTIPFSEGIGFIANVSEKDAIDYAYYVTAHEVAHQWWAHQVIGANVQGATVLSESLSQYSALMVMEKKYGREKMRRFLKYELDSYLRARGGETVEELPLYRVENQAYIHYRKGSLVFYRLREEIGEDALNRALARFVADKAFQHAPFTTSAELLQYIEAEAGPEHATLIDDLFRKITFYDNRLLEATSRKLDNGKYEVTLKVQAAKKYADGKGKESEGVLDDWIEVGVFARAAGAGESEETVLSLNRQKITAAESTFTVVVDQEPYDAGFDPYNKLIDRVPTDNRKRVVRGDG